jgi:uncharacterized protein (DUF1697 family)
MTKYVALIRALNVGGTSVIKMTDLKEMFESFGLDEVSTYIQSGNVIFKSKEKDLKKVTAKIEKGIKNLLEKELKILVFTSDQLRKAVDQNPFDPAKHSKEMQCQLMFLSEKPEPAHQKALMEMQKPEYQFAFWDKIFYYSYSKEWGGKRRNINFEKVLGVYGTTRTWKVVKTLIELGQ